MAPTIQMGTNRHWSFEGTTDALRGPKGDTAFLKDNYRLMGAIGGIFRTPKARFSRKQIHAGATKAGFIVRVDEDGLWNKVTVIGKIPPAPRKPEKPMVYLGAGKNYPPLPQPLPPIHIATSKPKEPAPDTDTDIDIFS